MKRQIKNLEEERSKLQEEYSRLQMQLQTAQACKYPIFCLDLALSTIIIEISFFSGSPEDHTRLVAAAAQALVDVIDSEEGSSNSKSLVERLEKAPQKIFDVMKATSKNYLTHMIGVVKSYLPQFNLAPIAKGIAPNCSDEKFREYCKESEVIAVEILKNMVE